MSRVSENHFAFGGQHDLAVALLGGDRALSRRVRSPLDAHELILEGFPNRSLVHLVQSVPILHQPEMMEKAIGLSLRTFQRRKKDDADTPLSPEQSGRAWKFAEILAKASRIFGSQQDAEAWLSRPATGLNRQRPIDLLETPAGVQILEEHLERLDYGVYA